MKLIESKTLGTAQASIEFTSIPQTFTDLVVLMSVRSTRADGSEGARLRLGNTSIDTGNNYSNRLLQGNGSTVLSAENSSADRILAGGFVAATATSSTFANQMIYIPNYTGSQNKSISIDSVTENNITTAFQFIGASLWTNSSPVARLIVFGDAGDNLVAGSMVSLYGILKGSDGIVTTSP
jgi:hypothetical protein